MLKIHKTSKALIIAVALFGAMAIAGYFGYQFFNGRIQSLESKLNQSVAKNEAMARQVQTLAEAYTELKTKPNEVIRQEIIKEKSQDELLTAAVAKAAPAVVSIAVSKDVPQLEVIYINPFGDDPFFRDFGIRIPQYRQKGTTEKKVGAGTGFIVSAKGYIVTNRHVVDEEGARYTVLLANGNQKPAEVIYRDSEIDIAILKIESGNYAVIALGNSGALKLGQSVLAIGNALGEYNNSVSTGIVSGLNRDLEARGGNQMERLQGVIQTDAAINPGNSGGPLVNLNGEAIGVNVAMANAENIGFAIPINAVKPIINAHAK